MKEKKANKAKKSKKTKSPEVTSPEKSKEKETVSPVPQRAEAGKTVTEAVPPENRGTEDGGQENGSLEVENQETPPPQSSSSEDLAKPSLGEVTQSTDLWVELPEDIYRKSQKKRRPPKVKKAKKSKKVKVPKPPKTKKFPLSVAEILAIAQETLPLLQAILKKLGRDKKVERLELEVIVGAEDPVETVELYGKIHAVVGTLWPPMDQGLNIQRGRVRVLMDFDAPGIACYGRFALSITLGKLLQTGLMAGLGTMKIMKKVKKSPAL